VITLINPDQDEETFQQHEPHQIQLSQDKQEEEEEEEEDREEVQIRTPHNLTPHIIVVHRIIDRILVSVEEQGDQARSDHKLGTEDSKEGDDDEGESATFEEEDRKDSGGDQVERSSSDSLVSRDHLGMHIGWKLGKAQSDSGGVQTIFENGTAEGQEENNGGDGDGEGRGNIRERRDASTSGPGLDDAGSERVAVLMGWTALVGVMGILAIAPAG